MKKLNALVASALLAVAGSGLAVTCSQDNVPAATLLVPNFRVEATVNADFTIGNVTVDTLLAITNVSSTGLIAHVTVWNKYSAPVYDYNIPVTGFDVVTWRMSDSINGDLNHNQATIDKRRADGSLTTSYDPCGIRFPAGASPVYAPATAAVGGWGKVKFIRFPHPQGVTSDLNADVNRSISIYRAKAFGPGSAFQRIVVGSLDESANITTFTSSAGAGILDVDNFPCSQGSNPPVVAAGQPTVLSGYVTIDVVNYCTNFFPDQGQYYELDAIATRGWRQAPSFSVANPGYTPNALMGDIFYIDGKFTPGAVPGNVSGDPMVHVEFDERLNYEPVTSGYIDPKTFYGRFVTLGANLSENIGPYGNAPANVAQDWQFAGDGREPLGERYGYRFLNVSPSAVTWLLVWRSSVYDDPNTTVIDYDQFNLCSWLNAGGPRGYGFFDTFHRLTVTTYNEDEDSFAQGGNGCPSGDPDCRTNPNDLYIFLESQRIALAGNTQINPSVFQFGWTDLHLKNRSVSTLPTYFDGNGYPYLANQGWIGVQHSAAGSFVSVGHAATLLDGDFLCRPVGPMVGNGVSGRLYNPAQVPVEQPYSYPVYSLQFNPNANLNVPRGVYSPR